jgi:Sulfatase
MRFLDAYSEQSCTAGRNAFTTGMNPLRTGLIVPQLPGSPSWLRAGTPSLAKVLLDLGYNTGQFDKNHLGDNVEALPTAHGFQESWGYLYHLDAMQQVSLMDVNRQDTNPPAMAVAPPCKATSISGIPDDPNAVDTRTTPCLTPPRPLLWCHSSDGTRAHQTCKDDGVVTDARSETLEEEVSAKVVDYVDRNDPKKTGKTIEGSTAVSALEGAKTYGWTQMPNLMRDPLEQNAGDIQKSATSMGGAITAPSTAYLYDWQMLPIGQLLWMQELETYRAFPPLQIPASYNLDEIEKMVATQANHSHSD